LSAWAASNWFFDDNHSSTAAAPRKTSLERLVTRDDRSGARELSGGASPFAASVRRTGGDSAEKSAFARPDFREDSLPVNRKSPYFSFGGPSRAMRTLPAAPAALRKNQRVEPQ